MGRKITNVILDLDSTIISSLEPHVSQPKGLIGHEMKFDDVTEYIVYERPYLQEFLDFLFENFKVAVWTAASKDYALFIVENIILSKPDRYLEFVLFDYHGYISEEISDINCPKDLSLVFNMYRSFTADNTIIVDDLDHVFLPQLDNAYPIPAFEADSSNATKDTELLTLRHKLMNSEDNIISKTTYNRLLSTLD